MLWEPWVIVEFSHNIFSLVVLLIDHKFVYFSGRRFHLEPDKREARVHIPRTTYGSIHTDLKNRLRKVASKKARGASLTPSCLPTSNEGSPTESSGFPSDGATLQRAQDRPSGSETPGPCERLRRSRSIRIQSCRSAILVHLLGTIP